MLIIVLNGGNYLLKTIALVLIFCRRSKSPCTIVREKKKDNKTKQKNRQAHIPRVTIRGREYRILLYSLCVSDTDSVQIQFINGNFSLITLVFVQYAERRTRSC